MRRLCSVEYTKEDRANQYIRSNRLRREGQPTSVDESQGDQNTPRTYKATISSEATNWEPKTLGPLVVLTAEF